MKKIMLIVLLFSFSCFAEEGFFTDPAKSEQWNTFLAKDFEKSVVKLEDKAGGVCTGSFISNDGYMLTAAHCLQTCLEGVKGTKNIARDSLYDINLYDNSILKGRKCSLRIRELGLKVATIVYIGSGSADFSDEQIERFPVNIRKTLSEILDFAVIKFETPHKTKCLKLSNEPVVAGEEIMSIGHPGRARRKSHSSDGRSKYFGFGVAQESLMGNEIYNEARFSTDKIAMLEDAYNLTNYFVGSVDMVPGFSGGPTLNKRGDILGVNTNLVSFADYTRRYVGDSALILRATTIQKMLEDKAVLNWSCN